jgi:dolichol-phosphate mannosyltransferase
MMRPLVIVPTYNERPNLSPLLTALLQIEGLRILIVDDQSPDGTGQEAERIGAAVGGERLSVLHRSGRRGFGLSYIDGMRTALATDATHICQMDADLSHDPADVPRLLQAADRADLSIGSRYVPGGRVLNWPWRRRALSGFANWYVRSVTGLAIRDCTSGFRCWRRDILTRLSLDRIVSDGYAFQVEMAWQAVSLGGGVVEVPITFVERREGASKMSGRIIAESVLLPWRLRAGHSSSRSV